MIEGLKPYPNLKDSGLPWLEQIPAHWKVVRNGSLFAQRNETGFPDLPVLEVSLKTGVRVRDFDGGGRKQVMSDFGKYKRAARGDLAYNMMRMWQGALGVAPVDGLVSPAYVVARPYSGVDPRFFSALFRTQAYMAEIDAFSRGIVKDRNRLYWDQFKQMQTPVPPPEEQAAIVKFLNWAGGRLEKAIRAKRKIIRLLEEQKQAIIHRAVTGGDASSQSLFQTGNSWFPRLPRGWEVLPLRRVISAAIDGPHFSPNYLDNGIPFLSARNVKVDRWNLDDAKYISENDYLEFSRRVKPEIGDILYTKGGTTGVARVVDLDFPFQVWVHIAVLKVFRNAVDPHFLALCLNSPRCYEQSQLYTRGATNQDLGLGRMKEIILPLPPTLEVQSRIVAELNCHQSSCIGAIRRIKQEEEHIREYRTRLISDVVTGKLDVRAAAASLPDIDTEPETMPDLEPGLGDDSLDALDETSEEEDA